MTYSIGEMAKLLDVAPSTLRFYDKEGLLPFVSRSSVGRRIFEEKDYEWLKIIECLKHTGMQLKDIREYIHLAMQGDETIEQRLELFMQQRDAVRLQMLALQETLDTLEFKCWYYETAKAEGATAVPRNMPLYEIPKQHRQVNLRMMLPEIITQKVDILAPVPSHQHQILTVEIIYAKALFLCQWVINRNSTANGLPFQFQSCTATKLQQPFINNPCYNINVLPQIFKYLPCIFWSVFKTHHFKF